ncbi:MULTISPECIES: oligosaccharide flippase family protein [unclassified Colwellia]|uniref:oligosaccharide flippase family protein n=1 Tax=unclassified Colwellia TaxID=196834 RepID=UPI0015F39B6F|nr:MULTISPECIES: oligosaccharide flippase family protein [unclassified Colwellia]MBA6357438.1 oligosaccharide flippase family protein [Colwellia sp. BRX8-3]MBA6361622.1 oligosaccharide flippase family protein [Colwellia sp. BRX8-6]MBA6369143.1 oligosaccharide flippase family protein [Colwellia sp. BRX8-5]MBA6374910.1 oligosaccharide flippase family protein [Colwellia sp. BRX8-2]
MSDISEKVVNSSFLMLSLRLFQRSIGLISTMILARVLLPEDFGLIAILTLVGLFFEILTQTGSEQYIIQKTKVDHNTLNTAFTLDIITKSIIWLLFIICVPYISEYYNEPQLKWALWASSLILPIGALTNPNLYMLKKNIDFKAFTKLEAFRKIFSFTIVMLVLIFEQSFWAIVAGDIASMAIAVLGSYVIAPYKPRLSKENIKIQWVFSKWMLIKGIFGFTRSQADTFLVSNFFGIADLGRYHMSKHIAYIPANDIIIPSIEPVFSALAESKNNAVVFKDRFLKGFFITFSIIFPLSMFIYIFPELIVNFLLGEKWINTYNVMSILGLSVLFTSINHYFETSMLALAKIKQVFIFDAITMVILIIILWFFPGGSVEEFTLHRNYLLLSFCIALLYITNHFFHFSLINLLKLTLPAAASTLVSIYLVEIAKPYSSDIAVISLLFLGGMFVLINIIFTLVIFKIPYFSNMNEVIYAKSILKKFKIW